jgi:methyl-accepting chemotaxis protein
VNQLRIATRLNLLVATLCVLLLAVGALGLYGMHQGRESLRSVYEDRTVPASELAEMSTLFLTNKLLMNAAMVAPKPEAATVHLDEIEANVKTLSKTWDAYTATHLTPEEKRLADKLAADRKHYLEQVLRPVVAALRANKVQDAAQLFKDKAASLSAPVDAGMAALVKLQVEVAAEEYASSSERSALLTRVALVLTAVAVAIGFGLAIVITRSIVRELGAEPRDAAALVQAVAAGDLTRQAVLRNGDATSLMAHLNTMRLSLTQVISDVHGNAESVSTASAQIAQGNADLSQRTEEQASALQQTSASMEELGATVRQNAENARQANQLARGASTVAVKGGAVVGEVVQTMKGISDSSRKISEIITVIDGIAFQTNILALNAAVEAARAGEQGRGFAVVAGEVRSLAQRSAEAAKEIKSLINASVERVEQGTALVDQAGSTMDEVVSSIKRVSDIVAEISAASSEQSTGIAQVGDAVGQMDQVTQQNAALVEQSAAAAESLKEQARALVQAVATFKITPGVAKALPSVSTTAPVRALAAQPWNGSGERRGKDRAVNVTRPQFGAAKTAAATPVAKQATGSDDWTSF